jgi:hypothetical protein
MFPLCFYIDYITVAEHGDDPAVTSASITSVNTLSEESLRHAKTWLHDCCRSHGKCAPLTPPGSWYPTRLLCFDSYDGGHCKVRIIDTAHEQPEGPYATLSHRWGNDNFIKLTRDNLAAFTEAIPIADLPKTFADAIFVISRIGIQYLWIDSLCILQDEDDLSDWLHEAGLMHKVYLGSHINISASVAESSSEGLSRIRNPSHLYGPLVDIPLEDSDPDNKFTKFKISYDQLWLRDVAECKLNKRGWVFQERLLSSRVLHFSHDQIFWECREHKACERYPLGDVSLQDFGHRKALTYFKLLLGGYDLQIQTIHRLTEGKTDSVYGIWNGMMQTYSKTSLTNPLDKLIALSGIAKQISGFTQDTYVAGMWRGHLETDLLWVIVDFLPQPDVAKAYRAPSWSWASVDGPIEWTSVSDGWKFFEIIDVSLQHETDDIMGLLKGGWLDVKGQLKPASVTFSDHHQEKPSTGRWMIDIDPTCSTDPVLIQRLPSWNSESMHVMLDVPVLDPRHFSDDNAKGRFFYMPVAQGQPWTDDHQFVYAWLLRLVDKQSGTFKRIGMVQNNPIVPGVKVEVDIAVLLAELKETVKETLPCVKYEDGRHTIRII